ncbi:lytic transglycosylase catalytic [Methylocaldum marinum]|uniref:Lytic transglycosylase catalytic n=2 Tax=Methylocaldum marinum TaxID=1432792 RepID=A0A250KZ37_9GAMM|nr:lytic transglycosylase catalytic [Methylocaldum marinum]
MVMKQGISNRSWITLGLLAIVFAGSAGSDTVPLARPFPDAMHDQRTSPFVEPLGLHDAVKFWRQVFGNWRLNQFALHDSVHLGVVYDVIRLPDVDGESLTPEHKKSLDWHIRSLQDQLRELESRVRLGVSLNDPQQRLFDLLASRAGENAVFGASQRVRSQRGLRERFLRGLEASGRYDRLFRRIFHEAALPGDLALLPHIESSFVNHAHSSAGAVGMWQFMRATARQCLHLSRTVDERYDPVFAARGAARYLAHAYDVLGDWGLAITSYNHGIAGMARAKAQFGPDLSRIVRYYDGSTFGFASRNFYAEFLAVRSIVQNLSDYFPEGIFVEPPIRRDLGRLTTPLTVSRLATLHRLDRDRLAQLNPAWTAAAIKGRSPLPAGIDVWLPRGTLSRVSDALPYVQPVLLAGDDATADEPLQYAEADRSIMTAGLIDTDERPLKIASRLLVAPAPVPQEDVRTRSKRGKAAVRKVGSKPSAKQKHRVHIVRRGESAYVIAAKYGIKIRKLLTLNAITQKTVLRPGQRLRIPAKSR